MGDSIGRELAYSGLQERVPQVQSLRLAEGFRRLRGATDDILTTSTMKSRSRGQADLDFYGVTFVSVGVGERDKALEFTVNCLHP